MKGRDRELICTPNINNKRFKLQFIRIIAYSNLLQTHECWLAIIMKKKEKKK